MTATNFTPIDHLLSKPPPSTQPTQSTSQTKENEPFGTPKEIIQFQEPLEKQLDEEVKPYVNLKKEKMEISEELRKIGLEEIDPSLFKDAQNVKLPLSDDKIAMGLQAPITSAFRWLATFALYLLKQSHMTLKTVHGKVVRIVQK